MTKDTDSHQRINVEDLSPEEFNQPASDHRGHNVRVQFRAQPAIEGQIDKVLSNKKIPYKNKGELCRHAIIRHLQWLEMIDGQLTTVNSQMQGILEVVRDEEFQIEFDNVFNRLKETVAKHVSRGNEHEARRFVYRIQALIESMPADYRKKQFEEEIKRCYGPMLQRGQKAKLSMLNTG